MEIKKSITIHLSEQEIKQIVKNYLENEGYKVEEKDIQFNVGTKCVGYGMYETETTCFKGCDIKSHEK